MLKVKKIARANRPIWTVHENIDEATENGQLTTDKPAANHHGKEAPDNGQLTMDKVANAVEQNDGRRDALAESAVRREDESVMEKTTRLWEAESLKSKSGRCGLLDGKDKKRSN